MKALKRARTLALPLCLALACEEGVSPSRGLEAELHVADGQYDEGAFPADIDAPSEASEGAPEIHSISSRNNTVRQGQADKTVGLLVSPTARTVAIWLEDDVGYWTVPAAVASVESAPDLEVQALLAFSRSTALGERRLWFAAADSRARYGSPSALTLRVVEPIPTGQLVVSLSWAQDMDLDLVVVQPDGATLSADGLFDAAGGKLPQDGDTAPVVDIDSNQACRIDGRRTENAIYPEVSLPGSYEIYARIAQACGAPQTGWQLRIFLDGKEVGSTSGQFYARLADTPNGGPSGPGLFVTRISVND